MLEILRVLAHSDASFGSTGHCWGTRSRMVMLASRRAPEIENIRTLCSENQTNCGTAPKTETNAAPAPIATKSAGRAQQIRVLREKKSVAKEKNLLSIWSSLNLYNFKTGVNDTVADLCVRKSSALFSFYIHNLLFEVNAHGLY